MDNADDMQRDYAIDFMKFIAVLIVMNSHMEVCYGNYSFLATGGAIGDALFFFISGYTLFLGSKMNFIDWYKKRISRIFPTIIVVGLLTCLLFRNDKSFLDVVLMKDYWFLQCIFICYIFLFPIIQYDWNLAKCFSITVVIMLFVFFFFHDKEKVIYAGGENYFRWILYFSIMLSGGYMCRLRHKVIWKRYSIPLLVISVLLWYLIIYGGGYFQILSFVPLLFVCVMLYVIGKAPFIQKMFGKRFVGNVIFIIGNLCLEVYLIQKLFFTNHLNNIFPMNIPLIMIIVIVVSYIVHIGSEIAKQCFDSKPFEWEKLFLRKNL